jgi:thiol:disulfide interchange protein DsbD
MRRLLLALLLTPIAAHALETAPVVTKHTQASIVTEADTASAAHPLRIALNLRIQPGWHTYWQNPGDAGAAPTLDVTGAKAGPIAYPTPQKLQDGPFTSYAYTDHVLLPVTIPPSATPLHLTVSATWLVCEKLCVPEDASFTLDIPAGTGAPGPQAPLFAANDAQTPRPSPFPASIAPDGTLSVHAPGLAPTKTLFLPAEPGIIDQGARQDFNSAPSGLTIHLKPAQTLAKPLQGVLLLTDQSGRTEALQIDAKPGAAPTHATTGLAEALLLAFLGGLVLNLMPCVLPVLAMKAMALARLSGAAQTHIRREAALYTAGVVAAFATIGAITLAVGAAGGDAGWGVQFQSATFTAAMALLMLGVGLNFAGVFEIGAGAAGIGQNLAARGSFFTGLLAVVVATPCTAPFMATALAAAIALPPAFGMAIFLALGLGLAFPYALLAVAPSLARLLPRPGAWMDTLRRVLSLPMFATAAWMGWVVLQQAGRPGLTATLIAAAALAAAAFAWGRTQQGDGRPRPIALAGLAACALALAFLAFSPATSPGTMSLAQGAEPFSPARLATLRAGHRPVLVDMSAAWCITCLVNERLALSPPRVRDAFARQHVAYLVGDWTRQDPAITAFLHEYGRNGVPLYVFFPAEGEPVVLPQILTQAAILDRIGA